FQPVAHLAFQFVAHRPAQERAQRVVGGRGVGGGAGRRGDVQLRGGRCRLGGCVGVETRGGGGVQGVHVGSFVFGLGFGPGGQDRGGSRVRRWRGDVRRLGVLRKVAGQRRRISKAGGQQ